MVRRDLGCLSSPGGDFLDACEAQGLWLFAETPSPPDDFINLWKSHPALVAWNIADDFNAPYSGTPNHPVAEVVARRDLTQSLAPAHLTYASGGSYPGYRIAEYAGAADVLAFQAYHREPDEPVRRRVG